MIKVTAKVSDSDEMETRYFSETTHVRLAPAEEDHWGTYLLFPGEGCWTVKCAVDVIARKIDNARNNQ